MPADRFFYAFLLTPNQEVQLESKEFHHLKNVTRTKQGAVVELVNGQGQLASAILKKIGKNNALLQVNNVDKSPKPLHPLILAQAIPRIHRLDFILEKGTELGLTEFWLFPGHHSERKKLTEHQIRRLRALTIAAMKQCGRLYLPTISIKPPLSDWGSPQLPAFFGDLSPNAPPLFHAWQQSPLKNEVLFFIGPESGFSDEEECTLRNFGATGVKLHQNILRTDTAAL
ncbi:MAG: RsmE family RNA methyltransferase, partial [Waddliaceae bacterium]